MHRRRRPRPSSLIIVANGHLHLGRMVVDLVVAWLGRLVLDAIVILEARLGRLDLETVGLIVDLVETSPTIWFITYTTTHSSNTATHYMPFNYIFTRQIAIGQTY